MSGSPLVLSDDDEQQEEDEEEEETEGGSCVWRFCMCVSKISVGVQDYYLLYLSYSPPCPPLSLSRPRSASFSMPPGSLSLSYFFLKGLVTAQFLFQILDGCTILTGIVTVTAVGGRLG